MAAVQFENPTCGIIEKVAIVSDRNHCAAIVL